MVKVIVEDACSYCYGRGSPPGQPLEKCSPCKGAGRKQRPMTLDDFAALFTYGQAQTKDAEGNWSVRNVVRVALPTKGAIG